MEMIRHLKGKAIGQGDEWVPTIEADGTEEFVQIGDVHFHYVGKTHNNIYGVPHWGKDGQPHGHKEWVCYVAAPPERHLTIDEVVDIIAKYRETKVDEIMDHWES